MSWHFAASSSASYSRGLTNKSRRVILEIGRKEQSNNTKAIVPSLISTCCVASLSTIADGAAADICHTESSFVNTSFRSRAAGGHIHSSEETLPSSSRSTITSSSILSSRSKRRFLSAATLALEDYEYDDDHDENNEGIRGKDEVGTSSSYHSFHGYLRPPHRRIDVNLDKISLPMESDSSMRRAPALSTNLHLDDAEENVRTSDSEGTAEVNVKTSQIPLWEVIRSKQQQQFQNLDVTKKYVEPVIRRNATVRDAIAWCIEGGLSGMMVVDVDDGKIYDSFSDNVENKVKSSGKRRGEKVVGMITSRDLLRILAAGFSTSSPPTSVIAPSQRAFAVTKEADELNLDGNGCSLATDEILSQEVGTFMTPLHRVIYARPNETIGMARSVMAKLGIKCLPVLSNGSGSGSIVEGLVTRRDLNEYGLNVLDRGGKKNYLNDVSSRVGLQPDSTVMGGVPDYLRPQIGFPGTTNKVPAAAPIGTTSVAAGQYLLQNEPLYINVYTAELPHPNKGPMCTSGLNGSSGFVGDEGAEESYSEDAHFVMNIPFNSVDSGASSVPQTPFSVTYMCVADGVGSWREYGVDPRLFSRTLTMHCQNVLAETNTRRKMTGVKPLPPSLPTPSEIIAEAYDRTTNDGIVGSSTICLGMFDPSSHQLHFGNLGDCGVVLLRHVDSDVAGSLRRNHTVKCEDRTTDLRVTFVSQQQLRSFNHPYQLGWNGCEGKETTTSSTQGGSAELFDSAADCCSTSMQVRSGDIIIMASDGLFDNVDLDDIVKIASEWEALHGCIPGGRTNVSSSSSRSISAKNLPSLAQMLCETAREKSLDHSVDSPFAILAKENDIMWSGGMPDDCTVIAMHVGAGSNDSVIQ